jgi:hypothetical protein
MKKEVAEKWAAALRSGEYQQTIEKLRDVKSTNDDEPKLAGSFCCLGVLCDLFAKEHPAAKWRVHPKRLTADFYPIGVDDGGSDAAYENERLPDAVQDWADMHSGLGCIRATAEYSAIKDELRLLNPSPNRGGNVDSLADANDYGVTFEQIADFIEQNWQNL